PPPISPHFPYTPLFRSVVIFAGGKVAPARSFGADNGFGKIIVGARRDPCPVQPDLLIGPLRPDLVPARDGALGGRLPYAFQFIYGDGVNPIIVGMYYPIQAVIGYRKFYNRLFICKTSLAFGFGDLTGGIGDLTLALAEFFEATVGSG